MSAEEELRQLSKNTGCSLHNDCLTCPFPRCRYDTVPEGKHIKTLKRQGLIKQMYASYTIQAIAEKLGIHVRTVTRALKEQ